LFLFSLGYSKAQVEVFKNREDTSTYIAPKDTITKAPIFENGDHDFFRYIENNFNMRRNFESLDYFAENINFSFYIDKDGQLVDYKHISGSNAIVSSELERIITKMPKWSPGYLNGRKKKTLMIYSINIRRVDDFPPVEVVKNTSSLEYSDQTKQIKWFIVAGSVLVLVTLWITSFVK
jgi:hypothetical protein